MMCIRGRQHPAHNGLVAGQIYEVYRVSKRCTHDTGVHAAGVEFYYPKYLLCRTCHSKHLFKVVPWNPDRFVPWNDPKVTIKEANDLYAPTKLVEEFL